MNQIEALNVDLNRLRGQLEVLNNSLENAQRRQRDMYLDLDTRLRRLEQAAASDTTKKQAAELEARVKKLEQQAQDSTSKRDQGFSDLEGRIKRLEQAAAAARQAGAQASTTQPTVPVPTAVL